MDLGSGSGAERLEGSGAGQTGGRDVGHSFVVVTRKLEVKCQGSRLGAPRAIREESRRKRDLAAFDAVAESYDPEE